ncbi:MAG TPA: hypothetical protein VMV45_03695 [Casimicrobiaceae bacterium]|nr:hypothetical protein [Casimicrobiaceae bacterium]
MNNGRTALVVALATALGLATASPSWAEDSGGSTNSKTNAATQRSEGLPSQNATTRGTMPVTSGTGAAVTTGTDNSFSATGSDDMNRWATDYAGRNRGRVSRKAYMDEMERRWDAADRSRQGLTPAEVSRLYGNVDSAAPPPRTGSGVQPGNMGPGNSKGD